MVVLTFGRLGDIVGQRRVFLPGLVVFTTLTWSLGFTQSVGMVMAQRFCQGVGAAMMLSGSLALVAAAYPSHRRGRTIGFVSACTYAGLSTGPVIGGYLTSHVGWRSIFWLAVPLGLAAIALGVYGMPETPRNAAGDRMDWRGSLAYGGSVGLIMLGAAHAKEVPGGPGMLAAGVAGLILFFRLERRVPSPLLDVSLLTRNRFFTFSCWPPWGTMRPPSVSPSSSSLYLQYAKGLSPRRAGLVLLLQPLLQVIASPVAGRLADRIEPARLASAGMLASPRGCSSRPSPLARSPRSGSWAGCSSSVPGLASSSRPTPRPSWAAFPRASSASLRA